MAKVATYLVSFWALFVVVRSCSSDADCSLNGICSDSACQCDAPWQGTSCGVLGYDVTPAIAKSLYPVADSRNTWNGPIVQYDGKYHMYNALYEEGSLGTSPWMMHGIADRIEGPYSWNLTEIDASGHHNPAFLVFPDDDGISSYSLWLGNGPVMIASSPFGPFQTVESSFHGSNPAPVYHNGAFYVTTQHTDTIVTASSISGPWIVFANISLDVPTGTGSPNGVLEDPFMWIDKRGNWHIINHAYDVLQTESCASSTLSAHLFSSDGQSWNILDPKVEPYGHTVQYDDGSSHTYTTLERPFLFIDESGQITHLSLAADLVTGDGGCKDIPNCFGKSEQGKCACTNCKWTDHAGSVVVQLDLSTSESSRINFV